MLAIMLLLEDILGEIASSKLALTILSARRVVRNGTRAVLG